MSLIISRPVRSKPLILASLLLAAFAINLDITIVNVALPSLVRELHATTSQLQWVVDAYSLVFAALILAALSVPTSKDPHAPRTDVPGLVLSTGAMAALIYTIIEAPSRGWASGLTLGGFALTLVLFAAFIVRERAASAPMLDLSLFSNPRFTAASGSVTVAFFSLAGFIF